MTCQKISVNLNETGLSGGISFNFDVYGVIYKLLLEKSSVHCSEIEKVLKIIECFLLISDSSIYKSFIEIENEISLSTRINRKINFFWNEYKWLFIIFLWIFAIFLGFYGFINYYIANDSQPHESSAIAYDVLRLFVVEGNVQGVIPIELELARFLAPLLIALAGLQAFSIIFSEQISQLRLKLLREHIIICGLGENGIVLAKEFYKQGKTVIVIENNPNHPEIDLIKQKVIIGDATDISTLKLVRAHKANSIFTTTGDDGINVEIAVELYKFVSSIQKNLQN